MHSQFDYFSRNFCQFQKDYYRYALIRVPLIYVQHDILCMIERDKERWFKLPASKACDYRDHYFVFDRCPVQKESELVIYQYRRHFSGEIGGSVRMPVSEDKK